MGRYRLLRSVLVLGLGCGLSVALFQTAVDAQGQAPGPAGAGPGNQTFSVTARLRGFQEVPTLSTRARGSFQAEVTRDAIQFQLTYQDLEGTATVAHIHFDQRHVATPGNIIAFLCGGAPPQSNKPPCPPAGTVTGTITAADVIGPAGQGIAPGEFREMVRAMRAGVTYANVHSTTFPNGEIRGQIRRVEVPPPPEEVEDDS